MTRLFLATFRTDAFDDVFHFMCFKTVGKGDEWNGVVFKAIGLSTLSACEMDVVEVVVVFATTDTVFEDT